MTLLHKNPTTQYERDCNASLKENIRLRNEYHKALAVWVTKHVKVGDIVRMTGTRDGAGFKKVTEIILGDHIGEYTSNPHVAVTKCVAPRNFNRGVGQYRKGEKFEVLNGIASTNSVEQLEGLVTFSGDKVRIEKFPNKPKKYKEIPYWIKFEWADEDYLKYNNNQKNNFGHYEKNSEGEWEYVRIFVNRTKVK